LRSQIQSFDGTDGMSRAASVCHTVVFQSKKGTRGKPHSVIWHVFPDHVTNFTKNEYVRDVRDWQNNPALRMRTEALLRARLAAGELIGPRETEVAHPESIVRVIVDHLEKNGNPGAKLTATLIPGVLTRTMHDGMYLKAMDDLAAIIRADKRVHSVRKRGASPDANLTGSPTVHVDGKSGKINRLSY